MGKSLEEILHLFNVAKKTPKGYLVHCPLPEHVDSNASLHLSEVFDGENRRLLLKDFAGCDTTILLDYINGKGIPSGIRILPPALLKKYAEGETPKEKPEKKIKAVYNYRNISGETLYQIIRFEPKEFKVRRFATKEEKEDYGITWVWEKPKTVIPYNLNLISELRYRNPDDYILKCEGELDCDTVTKNFEMVATCNPFGANKSKWYDLLQQEDPNWKEDLQGDFGKWPDSFSEYFKDLKIVLIPDHDKPGYVHVFEVFFKLAPHVKSIKILELPGPKNNHDDFTDWFRKNPSITGAELKNLFENAEELKDKTLEEVVKLFPVPNVDIETIPEPEPIVLQEVEIEIDGENFSNLPVSENLEFLKILKEAEKMLDEQGSMAGLCKICRGTDYVYKKVENVLTIISTTHENNIILEKCTHERERNLGTDYDF